MFEVFGPKIIANRERFADHALETRCLTMETQDLELPRDIPRQLPPNFFEEARRLRNKLLQWRFDRWALIKADESKLLHLSPRLTQIGVPIYSISTDPAFQERFVEFLEGYDTAARRERPQAEVGRAIIRLLEENGQRLMVKQISDEVNKAGQGEVSPRRIGSLLRSMGLIAERTREGFRLSLTDGDLSQLREKYGEKREEGSVNV